MFDEKLKQLKEKQAEVLEKIQRYTNADEKVYLTANMVLNLTKLAKEVFIGSEAPNQGQILNFLLQNCKLEGKNLKFELKNPFNEVFEANSPSNMLRGLLAMRTCIIQEKLLEKHRLGELAPNVLVVKL